MQFVSTQYIVSMGLMGAIGWVERSEPQQLYPVDSDIEARIRSTQTPTMSDFVELDAGHSRMRKDGEVAQQTIHFLKYGSFRH